MVRAFVELEMLQDGDAAILQEPKPAWHPSEVCEFDFWQ